MEKRYRSTTSSGANQGVWTVALEGDRQPVVFADSTENTVEKHSVFSPDGHWIAYMAAPISTIGEGGVFYHEPGTLVNGTRTHRGDDSSVGTELDVTPEAGSVVVVSAGGPAEAGGGSAHQHRLNWFEE